MNSSGFTNTLHRDKCYWHTYVSGRYKSHNFIREQQLNIVSEMSETTQQKGMLQFLLHEVQSALIWNGCSQEWLLISQEFLLSFKHVFCKCVCWINLCFQCKWNDNGGKMSDLPSRCFSMWIQGKVSLEDNVFKQETTENDKRIKIST